MSLVAMTALRELLRHSVPINDFFQTHYGKPAKHLIGYKKAPTAHDFPSICYVMPRATRGGDTNDEEVISIVIGVHEPGITDDVFNGVARLAELEALVLAELTAHWLVLDSPITWQPPAVITTDMGTRHPFYETEISIKINFSNW